MFGIFKKKQPNALDGAIRAIYGDHPPTKSADLERAVTIAHEDLLCEAVRVSEVQHTAGELFAGPMPYSTYDLSVATALSFFKNPELVDHLKDIQIGARLRVLNWMKAGKVAPGVLRIFEDTLYRVYKPTAEASDRDLEAKFAAFKQQNIGKTLHDAAKVVRNFIVWQAGFSELEKLEILDDLTDAQKDHARRVERAFLLGAAGMAAEAFSVPDADENLFLMNVVGMYKGLGPVEAENEIAQMFEASDVEENATKIGGAVMIDYLANGKSDKNEVHLAALKRECWGLSRGAPGEGDREGQETTRNLVKDVHFGSVAVEFTKQLSEISRIKDTCLRLNIKSDYDAAVVALGGFGLKITELMQVRDHAEMLEMERELVNLGKTVADTLNLLQAKGEDHAVDFSKAIRPVFENMKQVLKSRDLI